MPGTEAYASELSVYRPILLLLQCIGLLCINVKTAVYTKVNGDM